mmetsp:Transcript_989/g.3359  ORF Transcript_989/g.3359 Transcript_989/m.3359 type:complete len:335 (+) Transcript_989:173-1177(+)
MRRIHAIGRRRCCSWGRRRRHSPMLTPRSPSIQAFSRHTCVPPKRSANSVDSPTRVGSLRAPRRLTGRRRRCALNSPPSSSSSRSCATARLRWSGRTRWQRVRRPSTYQASPRSAPPQSTWRASKCRRSSSQARYRVRPAWSPSRPAGCEPIRTIPTFSSCAARRSMPQGSSTRRLSIVQRRCGSTPTTRLRASCARRSKNSRRSRRAATTPSLLATTMRPSGYTLMPSRSTPTLPTFCRRCTQIGRLQSTRSATIRLRSTTATLRSRSTSATLRRCYGGPPPSSSSRCTPKRWLTTRRRRRSSPTTALSHRACAAPRSSSKSRSVKTCTSSSA